MPAKPVAPPRHPHRRLILLLIALILAPPAAQPGAAQSQFNVSFVDLAFQRVWTRTDGLVADGSAVRSWVWGPGSWAAGREPYAEGPGGTRVVQYFDKGRMEVNDPTSDRSAPGYVTNGLLVVEMVSGAVQVGERSTRPGGPALEPVAGDPRPNNPDAPDYAGFRPVASLAANNEAPNRTGRPVDATISRSGVVGRNAALGRWTQVAHFNAVPGLRHNIPEVFWTFLNSQGPVLDAGQPAEGPLLDWQFTVGYPITEAYWARMRVEGKDRDVLIQLFQRRVLTYDPAAPAGWQVQMGNVGQHYYRWRYEQARNPVPLEPLGLPRYAVDTHWQSEPPMLRAAAESGAGLARIGVAWSAIEAEKSTPRSYHWEAYDEPFKRAAAAGMPVLASINECPAWACASAQGPLSGATPDEMAEFMSAVVRRYSQPPYNVHYWELFNEPDSTNGPNRGWGFNGTAYARMLAKVTPAIRAADPQARIFLGGLAYDWFITDNGPFYQNFLEDVISAGGAPYFDYVNFHYYPQNIHWPTFPDKIKELRSILETAKVNKPIVCTETGLTTASNPEYRPPAMPPNSPEQQARWLVKVHVQGFAYGLQMMTWFPFQDFTTDVPGYQIFTEAGLLRFDGTRKPGYTAYQTLTRTLGDAPFSRIVSGAGQPLEIYEFTRPDGRLWIAWSNGPNTTLPLPAGATVTDLYGRRLPGPARVAVGQDPVYLVLR